MLYMKLQLLLFGLLNFAVLIALLAEPSTYITTPDGVIILTDSQVTGTSNAVKLEVISDNIIRVIVSPGKEIAPTQSLVTIYNKRRDLSWNIFTSKESLTLKTKVLIAIVNLKSGVVSFWNLKGKKILSEKPTSRRNFQPAVFDGKPYYHLTQTFQITPDDAWYGFGQQQDGTMNNRAQQATLFQNNTEVAVPFLISS
jgi:alpha-D-xyloside xylohydrolase